MPTTTPENSDHLKDLLDRVEAMIDSGAATVSQLAEFLLPDQKRRQAVSRVSEWVRSRSRTPNGETALRLHKWAEAKTLEIAGDAKAGKAYRAAFKAVKAKPQTQETK